MIGLLIGKKIRSVGRRIWTRRKWIFGPLALLALSFAALLLWPMDRSYFLKLRPSGEMMDRSGRQLAAFMNERQQWCFVRDLSEISPFLIQATIATEDHRFSRHLGVDPVAAARAVFQNLTRRRVVSGASTLTMQVVKQAEGPAASLAGKLVQAVQALRLERRAGKDKILHAYLNNAPYGLNLIGCEAAARRYFDKPSMELTLAEAALVAGLPKAPTSFMPLKHPGQTLRRRNHVLRRMLEAGCISQAQYRLALAEPIRARWRPFPSLSPHLAMRYKPAITRQGRLVTTLDQQTQDKAELLVRQNLTRFRGEVDGTALLVIDVSHGDVLAHLGSPGFFGGPKSAGQVDASRAARSPGSALKPFTYALAMENNSLYSSEMLLDDSLDYGLYNPENIDRQYHGLVTAADALRRSLNIPAITVLDRIGGERLYKFLLGLNLTTLKRPAEYYGLGLTLGSCEVRLEELTAAYCMLASLGEYRPLRFFREGPPARAKRMLSRGTCLNLYGMLEQSLPAELSQEDMGAISVMPRVCWKTGTSWGHHDAWAFVFNRQYLVAVWVGNQSGAPSKYLLGAQAALPLAAAMFRSLKPTSEPAWPSAGAEMREIKICAVSGLPASQWCKHTRSVFLPRNQYLNRICDMHYPGADAEEGESAAAQVLERWPGSAKAWNLAHISRTLAGASAVSREKKRSPGGRLDALSIRIPANHAEFILTHAEGGDRIRLTTSVDQQTLLYWYLNNTFIGASEPTRPLMLGLTPGKHKLVCMTPEGLTDQVQFEVGDPAAAADAGNQ